MCPYGMDEDKFRNFLLKPRNATFKLKDTDIVASGRAELLDTFGKEALAKGFTMDPPMDLEEIAEFVRTKGTAWDQVILETYRREGKIVYREVEPDVFEATVSVPSEEGDWPIS